MKLLYLGHSAFMVEGDKIKALIDPFISNNPTCKLSIDEIDGITHIFLTHGHGDHLGNTVDIAKKCSAIVVCNVEMGWYFSSLGLKIHPMYIGGRAKMDFGTIKMAPALHGSGIKTPNGPIYGGNPCGFIIEVEGKKIYHAGDTGLSVEMQLLKNENIEVAMIPIGGNYTMDIDDAVIALDFIRPKIVIPIHYKTFEEIDTDPHEFKNKVKASEVIVLSSGQSIEV